EPGVLGAKVRGGVVLRAPSESGVLGRAEIVEEQVARPIAIGDVGDSLAVARPDGVRLDARPVRARHRLAALARAGGVHLAVPDKRDLLAIGRERHLGEARAIAMVL